MLAAIGLSRGRLIFVSNYFDGSCLERKNNLRYFLSKFRCVGILFVYLQSSQKHFRKGTYLFVIEIIKNLVICFICVVYFNTYI